jgi:hypothetical protein
MATLEQLSAALIKADAAGNTEDAKALADAIRKMRAEQSQPRGTVPAEEASLIDVRAKRLGPDISKMGMGATGAQTTPYGAQALQGPVTMTGAILGGLGGGVARGMAGITELGARAVGAEGVQQGAKAIRESIPGGLAEYKEAYPMTSGVAEFVGEAVAPTAALMKAGQALKAVGAAAPALGRVLTPAGEALATGGFRTGLSPGVANRLAQLAGGATAAGATQAMLSGDISGETGTAAGVGAALPIVLPALGQLGYKGLGKAVDYFTGAAPQVKAGEIARKAAGPELEAIQKALKEAPEDLTAGQAAAYVKQPAFQALQDLAERQGGESGRMFKKLKGQEIGRQKQLAEQAPLLSEAETARKASTEPIYQLAFIADEQRLARREAERLARIEEVENSGLLKYSPAYKKKMAEASKIEIPPQIKELKGNPIVDDAAKEAIILAKSQGLDLGDPMASLRGLHYMKIAIDNQFANKTASTSLQKYNEQALTSTKQKLLDAIEGTDSKPGISKVYGLARQKYAELSKPVNQAKIFDELQKVLAGPGSVGEKESAFLNILGASENALIKRAGGQPRFGGLREALTPEQMAAFEDVAAQLQINKLAQEQVGLGREALAKIIQKETQGFRFPWLMGNRYTAAGNVVLDELAGRLNEKTMNALIRGMESGKSANELLNMVPATERYELMRELAKSGQKRPLGFTVGAGQTQVERQ